MSIELNQLWRPDNHGGTQSSTAIDIDPAGPVAVAVRVALNRPVTARQRATVMLEFHDCDEMDGRYGYPLRLRQARALAHGLSRLVDLADDSAPRSWNGVDHPGWCDVERCTVLTGRSEWPMAVEHMSRLVDCASDRAIDLSVYLWRPAVDEYRRLTTVRIQVIAGADSQGFPLPLGQARALRRTLDQILIR